MNELASKLTKRYILNCIDNTNYSDDTLASDKQKLDFLKSTFEAEYNHMITRLGYMDALASWIRGATSTLNTALYHNDQVVMAALLGWIPAKYNDKEYNQVIDIWYDTIAKNIIELFNGIK